MTDSPENERMIQPTLLGADERDDYQEAVRKLEIAYKALQEIAMGIHDGSPYGRAQAALREMGYPLRTDQAIAAVLRKIESAGGVIQAARQRIRDV